MSAPDEDSLEARAHQLIGRQRILTELATVVAEAAEDGEGLEAVVDWLNQQGEEMRAEGELIALEARRKG